MQVIDGPNFSGRTERLREWTGLNHYLNAEVNYSQYAYIGPDITSALSGIAPTVNAEFELAASDRDALIESRNTLEELGFGYCLNQNPFTLSGGEQAVVAILAATAMRPKRFAIDCALEQLSPDTRTNVLSILSRIDSEIMIADNRRDEWWAGPIEKLSAKIDSPALCPEVKLRFSQDPCEVELFDLSYSYTKGRIILDKLNLKFEAGVAYQLKGPNGCGKSTLSKILSGLLRPTSGEIRVNGKTVKMWRTPGKFFRYHFQNPDFQLFSTTVNKQLTQSGQYNSLTKWFGLDQFLNHHPLDLPFVLRKRVALATTMSSQAGFLIFDEPTLGQDKNSSQSIITLSTIGVSSIIVSHSRNYSNLSDIWLG